ncbi:MAG: sodium/proline symporter [Gammaproteobacteria bacterium]|jgi:sodium/proline symporter|nr:sodium/proline symporter [Gammaproteobacteria bacterium]MBQ0775091.1 sodium/proline symporter [Gammaproteobacteria bacterium]|tara:strand:- start:96515 stop:97939 length:1425 start_codon:yes stop_codon:yes gene_type:complete
MLLASFGFFLLIFLLIGFSSVLVGKKQSQDYLVAGRSVPPFLVGLSAVATNNSGYMFIGVIGFTYATGLSAGWLMVGWIAGDYIASSFVHRRLREAAESNRALTFPELLSTWGGEEFAVLRRLIGAVSVLFLGVYAAAQFNAGSKAMHVVFGWDYHYGAILGAVMVLFYCFSGGLRASIWTDAAQSVVMISAMAALLWISLDSVGGVASAWQALDQVSATHMNWFPDSLAFPGVAGPLMFVIGWMFAGFGVIGQPHIMVRFMALDSVRNLSRARLYYYAWFIAFYFLANAVGLVSRLLIPEAGFDAELALPTLALQLLSPAVAGLVLAGLFAATISTADSLILSCSAALSRDLPPARWQSFGLTRYSTLAVIVLALAIALLGNASVFQLVIVAWAVLASALGPLLVVYALGGRPVQWVAVLMVCVGLATVYGWRAAGLSESVYEVMPAMLASWLVYIMAVMWAALFSSSRGIRE